jgi:limonene-1,2-epoxide hydrolase
MLLKEYTMQKNESSAKSAKEIVMEYIEALERKDFKSARSYISDNISYVSPLNSFDRAEPYLKYNEHLNLPKWDIKKVFADGQDVCLLYEMNFGTPPVTLFVCGWFHVNDDGKISSLRIVFDPRPFIQQK